MSVLQGLSRSIHKVGFAFKRNSPTIYIACGVAGVVVSGIAACVATAKAHDVLEEAKEHIEEIKETAENDEEETQMLSKEYIKTGVKLTKLYAPSVIIGALSLTSIITSHRIMGQRNISLAAAYTAVDRGFKKYRSKVIDKFGNDVDKELLYDVKTKEIETTVVNKDGKEEKVTKTVKYIDTDLYSPYAKWFDETSEYFTRDSEYNIDFVKNTVKYLNEQLRIIGHMFLADVYKAFGIAPTRASYEVGWIYDEKNTVGDNYIDVGLYSDNELSRAFINGFEKRILLDFNVDGPIVSRLDLADY